MNILKSYIKGIVEATIRPKMISLLWLFNFLFASLVYFLFSGTFSQALGKSLAASELLKGHELGKQVMFEFLTTSGGGLQALFRTVLLLTFLFLPVSMFLQGGVLHALVYQGKRERFAPSFFQGGGKFFGRFFRLTLYSLVLGVLFIIFFLVVNLLLGAATKGSDNELLKFYLMLARLVLALFLFYLYKMILDYARIKIAVEDSWFVLDSLFVSLKFVFRKFGKTLFLFYLLGVTGVLIIFIYWGIRSLFAASSAGTMILGFILAQLFILSRAWLRIAFAAAQMKLFTLETS